MEKIDSIVIGAGVVGLAVARTLAAQGRDVVILEAESTFGTGISARSSEVIHAGIHYPAGSLKARLCVRGRQALTAYCAERAIPHRRCGKLIVANNPTQLAEMDNIAALALANGVNDLQWLDQNSLQALEPALSGIAALRSPSTGIVDSHALMHSLLGDAENAGAVLACHSPVIGGEIRADGIVLEIGSGKRNGSTDDKPPYEIQTQTLINCAGLGAQPLARQLRGIPIRSIPPLHYAKGNYYSLSGPSPFSHLIYPIPEAHGLGIHLTLDLAGQARFGPDVEWVEQPDYQVSPTRAANFYDAIRRYWPALPDGALQPAYAGVRPKPHAPSASSCDFLVSGPVSHGIRGLINLYGIESPGLTASLALADYVVEQLKG